MNNEHLGPPRDSLTFWLPVRPRPKPYEDANRLAKSRRARAIKDYHRQFVEEVQELTWSIVNFEGRHLEWRLDLFYSIRLKYYLPLYKKGKLEGGVKRADLDNLTKSLLDCFNGVVWDDDSQVFQIADLSRSTERYSPSGQPGIYVSVVAYDWQDWM